MSYPLFWELNQWIRLFHKANTADDYTEISRQFKIQLEGCLRYSTFPIESLESIAPYLCSTDRVHAGNTLLKNIRKIQGQAGRGMINKCLYNRAMNALLADNKLLKGDKLHLGLDYRPNMTEIAHSDIFREFAARAFVTGDFDFLDKSIKRLGCSLRDISVNRYAIKDNESKIIFFGYTIFDLGFPIENLLVINFDKTAKDFVMKHNGSLPGKDAIANIRNICSKTWLHRRGDGMELVIDRIKTYEVFLFKERVMEDCINPDTKTGISGVPVKAKI